MLGTILVIGLVIYFLPTIIGAAAGVRGLGIIFLINLFLGWTVAGWLVVGLWVFQGMTGRPRYILDRGPRYRAVRDYY